MDGVVAGTPEVWFHYRRVRAHARWRDSEPVSATSGTWADFWRPASLRGGSGVRPTEEDWRRTPPMRWGGGRDDILAPLTRLLGTSTPIGLPPVHWKKENA